ncbi:hypothetical protein EV182_002047 [Spiromyces aspiralis]|uniref:Uncharacterized protein n=1 Tax=Spiromyces aspiralis TaxID=68401 RepID=A0ACC1HT76_9FUNG|nr:hypothetical protein EV182_002047 [Spiromyces aspiralis]
MLDQVLHHLAPRPGGWYCDATFGEGGYTKAILDRCECGVVAVDQDPDAVAKCTDLARAPAYSGRLVPLGGSFGDLERLARSARLPPGNCSAAEGFDGVVFDLGLCTSQISDAGRGFSYLREGPLDMRMDVMATTAIAAAAAEGEFTRRRTIPASVVINSFPVEKLAQIFREYGEERHSTRIARAIDRARSTRIIATTTDLAAIIRGALPSKPRARQNDGGGPIPSIARVFQGLRIYVNDELGQLERGLSAAARLLVSGGRLVVVTFHSLEDQVVKRFLLKHSAPRSLGDDDGGSRPTLSIVTKKAVKPTKDEVSANPPSRSAKLRAAERIE